MAERPSERASGRRGRSGRTWRRRDSAPRRRLRGLAAALAAAFAAGSATLGAATFELKLALADGAAVPEAVVATYALEPRPAPPPKSAVMDQRGRRFTPQVLVVQRGAVVTFPNSDDVSHHVYSFSPAKRFELFLAKGKEPKSVEFDQAGIVTLGCNLHDWMLGYIAVVDTPHFAITGADGSARLADLPPGRYRVEVWHPRATDPKEKLTREVDLTAGGASTWELRLAKPLLPARDQHPGFPGY